MSDILSALHGLLARLQGTPLEDPVFVMGVVGGALLVAGSRLYKLALIAPGLAAGLLLGLEITEGASSEIRLVAGLCLGLIGAGVLLLVERLAISLGGAFLLGGLANAAVPLFLPGQDAWYVPVAGAVLGLLMFPKIYKSLLFVLTALGGALCIAWAIGRPQDLPVIGGLWLVGTIIQWLTRPAKGE